MAAAILFSNRISVRSYTGTRQSLITVFRNFHQRTSSKKIESIPNLQQMKFIIIIFLMAVSVTSFSQQKKPRARDIGIPFDGTPGKYNAITDVAGVEVGHTTLIEGSGKLEKGKAKSEIRNSKCVA